MYGSGIVMNYASGIIKNNIIANNRVYQAVGGTATFGGGGIWQLGSGTTTVIHNNTIVDNISDGTGSPVAGRGGAILIWNTPADARNNIIWGNMQGAGGQIYVTGIPVTIIYNDVQDGWQGEGNIIADPLFVSFGGFDYLLRRGSPCIDAGDPTIEDGIDWPVWYSNDTRSDMGYYGGPDNIGWLHYPGGGQA
jgi:hypothetical protein